MKTVENSIKRLAGSAIGPAEVRRNTASLQQRVDECKILYIVDHIDDGISIDEKSNLLLVNQRPAGHSASCR